MLLKRFPVNSGVFCGELATGLMSGKFITIGSVNRWAWSAPWRKISAKWPECEAIIENLYPELGDWRRSNLIC